MVEDFTVRLRDAVGAEIIEAPGHDMRGLPYGVTEATGYIIDDDATRNALPDHAVTSACHDLKVAVREVSETAEVRIRSPVRRTQPDGALRLM